jgi:hypothetical protein
MYLAAIGHAGTAVPIGRFNQQDNQAYAAMKSRRDTSRRMPSPGLARYATFCILFAKSRPEVGGGSALPSLR